MATKSSNIKNIYERLPPYSMIGFLKGGMMLISIFCFMVLLQIKHLLCDYVWQTAGMLKFKGVYGNSIGIKHSLYHGIGSMVCFLIALPFSMYPLGLVLMGFDILTHYHIDWVKVNYGCSDLSKPAFWTHLGLDQLAHQMIYIVMVGVVVLAF